MSVPRDTHFHGGGWKGGITVRGVPLITSHQGETFWVDSTANSSGQERGTWKHPCLTIDAAMSLCLAERGDVILCKPGHVETISADDDLVCDVNGVAIIGLGTGSKQACIKWTADVSISVSAVDVSFVNIWFWANYANVDNAIDVDAGAHYLTIEGCKIYDPIAGSLNFEEFLTMAAAANFLTFKNNYIVTTAGESIVLMKGECISPTFIGNTFCCNSTVAIVDGTATAQTGTPVFIDNVWANWDTTTDICLELKTTTVAVLVRESAGQTSAALGAAHTGKDVSFCLDCEEADEVNKGSVEMGAAATAWS